MLFQNIKINFSLIVSKAKDCDISVGDCVLIKKDKRGKLDANFGKDRHIVVGKQGSEVVCESNGKIVRRNSTFVKVVPNAKASEPGECQSALPGNDRETEGLPLDSAGARTPPRRSQRCIKPPERFGDYVVHALVERKEKDK